MDRTGAAADGSGSLTHGQGTGPSDAGVATGEAEVGNGITELNFEDCISQFQMQQTALYTEQQKRIQQIQLQFQRQLMDQRLEFQRKYSMLQQYPNQQMANNLYQGNASQQYSNGQSQQLQQTDITLVQGQEQGQGQGKEQSQNQGQGNNSSSSTTFLALSQQQQPQQQQQQYTYTQSENNNTTTYGDKDGNSNNSNGNQGIVNLTSNDTTGTYLSNMNTHPQSQFSSLNSQGAHQNTSQRLSQGNISVGSGKNAETSSQQELLSTINNGQFIELADVGQLIKPRGVNEVPSGAYTMLNGGIMGNTMQRQDFILNQQSSHQSFVSQPSLQSVNQSNSGSTQNLNVNTTVLQQQNITGSTNSGNLYQHSHDPISATSQRASATSVDLLNFLSNQNQSSNPSINDYETAYMLNDEDFSGLTGVTPMMAAPLAEFMMSRQQQQMKTQQQQQQQLGYNVNDLLTGLTNTANSSVDIISPTSASQGSNSGVGYVFTPANAGTNDQGEYVYSPDPIPRANTVNMGQLYSNNSKIMNQQFTSTDSSNTYNQLPLTATINSATSVSSNNENNLSSPHFTFNNNFQPSPQFSGSNYIFQSQNGSNQGNSSEDIDEDHQTKKRMSLGTSNLSFVGMNSITQASHLPKNEQQSPSQQSLKYIGNSGLSTPSNMESSSEADDLNLSNRKHRGSIDSMTSSNSGSNVKHSKSGRVVQACDSCRARKNKCDGNQPLCAACKKGGIPCKWTPKGVLRKRKNFDHKTILFDEHGILTIPISGVMPNNGINFNLLSDMLKELGVKAEMIQSSDSDIYDRLIGKYLEDHVGVDTSKLISIKDNLFEQEKSKNIPYLDQAETVKAVGENKLFTDNTYSLNDEIEMTKEIQTELLNIFFNKVCFTYMLNFIQRDIFMKDFHAGLISEVLLLSIFAHASKFQVHQIKSKHELEQSKQTKHNQRYYWGDTFYNKSKKIVSSGGARGIDGIQALVLLSSYAYKSGRTAESISFSLLASAGALAFGLNTEPKPSDLKKMTFYEREMLKRTFWGVFVLDRHISWILDTPKAVITRSDINVAVPCPKVYWDAIKSKDGPRPNIQETDETSKAEDPLLALLPVYDIFDRIWHEQKAMLSGLETDYGMMSSFLVSSVNRRLGLQSFDESRWPRFMRSYRKHVDSLNNWMDSMKYKSMEEAPTGFVEDTTQKKNGDGMGRRSSGRRASSVDLSGVESLPPSPVTPQGLLVSSQTAQRWIWLYCFVIYHTAQILLFKPAFLRSASHILRSKNKNWKLSHGTKEAVTAACNVMDIMKKYVLPNNEGFGKMHGSVPMVICLSLGVFADILVLPSLTDLNMSVIESHLQVGIQLLKRTRSYIWVVEVCLHGLRLRIMAAQDQQLAARLLKLIPEPIPRRIV